MPQTITTLSLAGLLLLGIMTPAAAADRQLATATLAGGCFWCLEKPFEGLPGVVTVVAGYTGGTTTAPNYDTYAAGGHVEAVRITFDPRVITYPALLDIFWRQIDPTDPDGQFVDRGPAYGSAIFYHDDDQRLAAETSREALRRSGRFARDIVTPLRPATAFYPAEDHHQDYYKKNPLRYHYYRSRSGRDQFLESVWGQETNRDGLRQRLTPLQFHVTQEEGTEPAFRNDYWDNKAPGLYVDVVSGEPLFLSIDKYDSGTGWPSFTRPVRPEAVVEREDRSLFSVRTEVRSATANSHLGHVFDDGPPPMGRRYCINSAALRFVPLERLREEGYAELLPRLSPSPSADPKSVAPAR